MIENLIPIEKNSWHYILLVDKCQENLWLMHGGAAFMNEPAYEADRPYSFFRVDDIEKLAKVFADGNWAIRNGFLYEDLCFINQVDGGDEWWTLKYDRQTKEYVAFESFTLIPIIENGGFETLIGRLTNATIEQCKALEY